MDPDPDSPKTCGSGLGYREFMAYLRIPDIVKRELELPPEVVWPGEGGVH
jgi:hypothetical protein